MRIRATCSPDKENKPHSALAADIDTLRTAGLMQCELHLLVRGQHALQCSSNQHANFMPMQNSVQAAWRFRTVHTCSMQLDQ